MLSNYYTFRALAESLSSKLTGYRIDHAFSQERDELAFSFSGVEGCLIISCRAQENTCFLHQAFTRARRNTTSLFRSSYRKEVLGASHHAGDRMIVIRLESGESLVLQFYRSKANVLHLDATANITDAFRHGKELRGTQYGPPRRDEPVYDMTAFRTSVQEEPGKPVRIILRRLFPELGSTLVHEILARSDVPLSATGEEIDAQHAARFVPALASVFADLSMPKFLVYSGRNGLPSVFSLITLRHLEEMPVQQFDDIHDAIRFFISRNRAGSDFHSKRNSLIAMIQAQVHKARRTINALDTERRESSCASDYEHAGQLLLTLPVSKTRGAQSARVRDGDTLRVITLDPGLTLLQNAQRYFEKAKRANTALRESASRNATVNARIAHAEQLVTALTGTTTMKELNALMDTHTGMFNEFGIGRRAKERAEIPFRIFTVEGGFEVWAGKSNTNNDLLTTRFAKPNDLWFHARGSSGSHVILRVASSKGEPSKKARDQAAGIAAYYSKMKKAKLVPVAMTERKYVRKPKGAPPGTVVLEREQTIFAQPALPAPPHEQRAPL